MDKVVADFLEGVLVCDRHGDAALVRSPAMDSVDGDELGKQPARGSTEPTTICMTASASASAPAPGSAVEGTGGAAVPQSDVRAGSRSM